MWMQMNLCASSEHQWQLGLKLASMCIATISQFTACMKVKMNYWWHTLMAVICVTAALYTTVPPECRDRSWGSWMVIAQWLEQCQQPGFDSKWVSSSQFPHSLHCSLCMPQCAINSAFNPSKPYQQLPLHLNYCSQSWFRSDWITTI